MTTSKDQELQQRARDALNERAEELDAATLSRLTQARYSAVDAAHNAGSRWLPWRIVGATAAVCAVVLTALLTGETQQTDVPDEQIISDFDLLNIDEDLELVEEPEFYHWLEATDDGRDDA